jgi:hypothetical protein
MPSTAYGDQIGHRPPRARRATSRRTEEQVTSLEEMAAAMRAS